MCVSLLSFRYERVGEWILMSRVGVCTVASYAERVGVSGNPAVNHEA